MLVKLRKLGVVILNSRGSGSTNGKPRTRLTVSLFVTFTWSWSWQQCCVATESSVAGLLKYSFVSFPRPRESVRPLVFVSCKFTLANWSVSLRSAVFNVWLLSIKVLISFVRFGNVYSLLLFCSEWLSEIVLKPAKQTTRHLKKTVAKQNCRLLKIKGTHVFSIIPRFLVHENNVI